MVYQWRFNMGVPADKAGAELERLEKKHGSVTPKLILQASRSEKAPLHKCFEWNDGEAAEKYRLSQAGMIIQNLMVVVEESPDMKPIKAFVNVVPKGPTQTGAFINIKSAMQDDETKAVVMANAMRELKEFESKYKNLVELSGVFAEIDKLRSIA